MPVLGRRRFLRRVGALGIGAVSASGAPEVSSPAVSQQSSACNLRQQAAAAYLATAPPPELANQDEQTYPARIGNYSRVCLTIATARSIPLPTTLY